MNFFRKRKRNQDQPPAISFPQTIELIPDRLYVEVFLHEVKIGMSNQSLNTLGFLTKGLSATGQKELFIAIQSPDQQYTSIPPAPIHFINTIYDYAQKGHTVDSREMTQFGERDLLGWKGVVYIDPPAHLAHLFSAPTLSVILLSASEVEATREVGTMRVLSMLGKQFTYYPFPYWSDLGRTELPISRMKAQSLLSQVKCMSWTSSHLILHQHEIRFMPFQGKLPSSLSKEMLPPEEPVALFPSLSPTANGCLTYSFDGPEKGPQAITPPGGNGSILSGCCLILIGGQEEYSSRILEDGFCLMLTDVQWEGFWDAFLEGKSYSLTSEQSYSFAMEWMAEGTDLYLPEEELPVKGPIHLDHIQLLADDDQLSANLDINALSDLIGTIEYVLIDSLEAFPDVNGRLRLDLSLHPDKEMQVDMASEGIDQQDCLQAVYDALGEIQSFRTKEEPIGFILIVNVRHT